VEANVWRFFIALFIYIYVSSLEIQSSEGLFGIPLIYLIPPHF
jgi:hypothetical protein